MIKYKINGVGLDTTNLVETNLNIRAFPYIHTSISSNNDYVVADSINLMNSDDDLFLISTIDFLDKSFEAISGHLKVLQLNRVDVLLIDAKCDFKKYLNNVKELVSTDVVGEIGLSNPSNSKEVEEIEKILGQKIKYISMDLCPLYFNYDLVVWCIKNKVKILGFNSFGGNISSAMLIDGFSSHYLLNFASLYCTLVFVSSRNMEYAVDDARYLSGLIGKEVINPKMYELSKSVNKLTKPMKKLVNVSMKFDENLLILPIADKSTVWDSDDIVINLSDPVEVIKKEEIEEVDEVLELCDCLFKDFQRPEDARSNADVISILRHKIENQIDYKYPKSEKWYTVFSKLSDNLFIISIFKDHIEKRIFGPNKVTVEKYHYIFYYSEGTIVLRKLRNANMVPSES